MLIFTFVGVITFGAASLASVLPLYGMTDAALLVFLGVLNYVAYRDIFERRSGNLPKMTELLQVGPTHAPIKAPL